MHIELVVMAYKSRHVLGPFLASVGTALPILLVDNSFREDDLSDILEDFPNVTRIDAGGNIGFSAAANIGAKAASAPYLVFMNPDTRPTAAALNRLVTYLVDNPSVGACGAAGHNTGSHPKGN